MIGLISQQLVYEAPATSQGPKFVTPGEKPGQKAPDDLNLFELALQAARDLLGPATEPAPRSSLQRLDQRNRFAN
ncbi:hypothetical protein [Litoreibacter janthinus]|nr:hypothetical protein [Litoreibacter janthinus]